MLRQPGPVGCRRGLRSVQLKQILRCDEPDSGSLFGMLDVTAENPIALLGGRRCPQMRPDPILTFSSRAAREVDRVPELGSDKFRRMKVRADHTSAAFRQLFRGGIKFAQNVGVLL